MDAELRAALARTDLPEVTRTNLRGVQDVLERDPHARLESFSMLNADPQIVVSFGDVEHADLVVYVTHGIDTKLDVFPAWAEATQRLCVDVMRACIARGEPKAIATVAWFGWDSGLHETALATTHATMGAARLSIDLDRVVARNRQAHIALVTYSYSSTLLGELFALQMGGEVDTAVSIGSAGMTAAGSTAVAAAIEEGRLAFYATEAEADLIAPLGRLGQHPVDPRDISGALGYDSDGGPAPRVEGGMTTGVAVGGHGAHTRVDEFGVRRVGYYDTQTQAYLTLVGLLADAVTD